MITYKRAFANRNIPHWDKFITVLQSEQCREFCEGYFLYHARSFKALLNEKHIGKHIAQLPGLVNDIFQLCALHVISREDDSHNIEAGKLREIIDISNRKLDPEVMLEGFNLTANELSKATNRHFNFNFRAAAVAAYNLGWALNCKTTKENKLQVEEILSTAVDTMDKLSKIYDVLEQYLAEQSVEAIHNFPQICTILKMPLVAIAGDFEEKVVNAGKPR